jgi:hypothetical protein
MNDALARALELQEVQVHPVSLADYLASVPRQFMPDFTNELRSNAMNLLTRSNRLLAKFGQFRKVVPLTGGWRPPAFNATLPNASPRSKHMLCQALDVCDPEGDFDQFVLDNQKLMEACGLWAEHPAATKGWAHLQSVPPLSGRRIFYP